MEKVMKSRYATIAIKPKVHDNIKKLAKHSYQTVGGYIEQLIEKEGRNPSPLFNTNSYLSNNPDVKISRINPFYHYLAYGLKERRKI